MIKQAILVLVSLSILGCASEGPSQSEITKALEAKLPAYFDVENITLEETENLGTKTDPLYKARFKSKIKANDTTFIEENSSSSSWTFNQPKITYLLPKLNKGDSSDLYGVTAATKYRDDWKITFDFDNSPAQLGKPVSFFTGVAFVRGSEEEQEYIQTIEEQNKLDKLATLNRFFKGERRGRMTGPFIQTPIIKFTSVSIEENKFKGELIFQGGIIKGFSGEFNDEELVFNTDRLVQGTDGVGVGSKYILRISNLNSKTRTIQGTYKHVDNRTGDISFPL